MPNDHCTHPGSGAQLLEPLDQGSGRAQCALLQVTETANSNSQLMHVAACDTLADQSLMSII